METLKVAKRLFLHSPLIKILSTSDLIKFAPIENSVR